LPEDDIFLREFCRIVEKAMLFSRKSINFIWPVVVVGLWLLAACGPAGEQQLPTPMETAVVQPDTIAQNPSATPTAVTPTEDTAPETDEDDGTATRRPATATPTPSITPSPTDTPIPTATPTSRPQTLPTAALDGVGTLSEGVPTPPTPIPTPVATFAVPNDVTNILLIGVDRPIGTGPSRSDTMIIVTVNYSEPTASVLSLPRDLFVYIPGGTMSRLNTAVSRGDQIDYPGGGVALLKQTILYNFGVPIHYYAKVDFDGFQAVVDAIGGVEMAVSCRLEDWRLISPDLDIHDEDSYERFALEPGIHHMDGDLALWYARSRMTTSDFDRGRRQQQLLRGMLNKGVEVGLVSQVPALYTALRDSVETDMDIGRILRLASLAPQIRENGVQHLYIAGKTQPWQVPPATEEGVADQVHLPVWEGSGMMEETFIRLFRPPVLNRGTQPPILVEIINASGNPDMARLAADNLAYHGLTPVISSDPPPATQTRTELRYFRPNFKTAYEWLVSWVFNMRVGQIQMVAAENEELANYAYDYQVTLGEDYNPCRPQLFAPREFLTED
jgi:polyisoprenyl-teichoic acid--peptidoglycan teichoic acid transferase